MIWSRAYDRAAIKFRGIDADINYNLRDYEDDMEQVSCRNSFSSYLFFFPVQKVLHLEFDLCNFYN